MWPLLFSFTYILNRVPIVILLFLALWALDVWVLDKLRMPYSFVLNVRTGTAPNSLVLSLMITVFSILQ